MVGRCPKSTHLKVVTSDPKMPPPELMDFMPMWKKKIIEEEVWDNATESVLANR